MKKIFWLFLLSAVLFGCSGTSHYRLKENWIDNADIQYALSHPALNEWYPQFGDPVVTELHADTVYFIYNYHPPLFATVKNGVEYKPTNNDRVNDVWGKRNEMLGMQIVNNRLVGIRNMTEYSEISDAKVAEKKERTPVWIWVVIGIAGTILTVVLANATN